jgi:hypothetical protein
MYKVFPAESLWTFTTVAQVRANCPIYASWQLQKSVQDWLEANCQGAWTVDSSMEFTWDVHDAWMNSIIDNMCKRIATKQIDVAYYEYWPYDVCKPHIVFSSAADALLFKLTF